MKMMDSMKKWVLISMLFVGISLTAYAVVPQNVFIEQMFIEEVGTTYVDICVTHWNTEYLIFILTDVLDETNIITHRCDITNDPASTIHRLDGLTPDTIYNLDVTAIGAEEETHHLWTQVITLVAY